MDEVVGSIPTSSTITASAHIPQVTAPELLSCLRRIEARGALDTTHRAHQNGGQVFRYAVTTGRAERDPAADLRGALPRGADTADRANQNCGQIFRYAILSAN